MSKMTDETDDKELPLNASHIPIGTQQDCPDGMKPAMVALAIMTTVIIFLICKNQSLAEQS